MSLSQTTRQKFLPAINIHHWALPNSNLAFFFHFGANFLKGTFLSLFFYGPNFRLLYCSNSSFNSLQSIPDICFNVPILMLKRDVPIYVSLFTIAKFTPSKYEKICFVGHFKVHYVITSALHDVLLERDVNFPFKQNRFYLISDSITAPCAL